MEWHFDNPPNCDILYSCEMYHHYNYNGRYNEMERILINNFRNLANKNNGHHTNLKIYNFPYVVAHIKYMASDEAQNILHGKYLGYYLYIGRSATDGGRHLNIFNFYYYVLYLDNAKLSNWRLFQESQFYRHLPRDIQGELLSYLYRDMLKINCYWSNDNKFEIDMEFPGIEGYDKYGNCLQGYSGQIPSIPKYTEIRYLLL